MTTLTRSKSPPQRLARAIVQRTRGRTHGPATRLLGGAGGFTTAIVGRLGVLSVLWLIGLVAACEVFRLLTSRLRHQVS